MFLGQLIVKKAHSNVNGRVGSSLSQLNYFICYCMLHIIVLSMTILPAQLLCFYLLYRNAIVLICFNCIFLSLVKELFVGPIICFNNLFFVINVGVLCAMLIIKITFTVELVVMRCCIMFEAGHECNSYIMESQYYDCYPFSWYVRIFCYLILMLVGVLITNLNE